MKANLKKISTLVFAAAALWFGYAAWQAHYKLVTLDTRNADVRDVIKKIERQTWENIAVQKEVTGKITLKVRRQPLDAVLNIIADQTSARWVAVYPLYSNGRSLDKIKSVAAGDLAAKENGWSAWLTRPFGRGMGMFGGALREDNKLISLQLDKKDVETASLALDRFGKSRVVAEDGTKGVINLKLSQATMPEAVAAVAKQADRKWTMFYVLQSDGGFGGRPPRNRTNEVADPNGPPAFDGGGFGPGGGFGRGGGFPRGEMSDEQKAALAKQFDAQLATMTPAERAQAEEMRKQMEEIGKLPQEERRAAMAKLMSSPERQQQMQQQMQNRMLSALKNTTPDQRVERDRQRLERQKQMQQRQAARP